MGFQYETDTAADIPDFFSNLEALLAAAGWTHVSGTGTTTIVYSSSGEVGTLTKLYIKIWRDGPNPERVYYQVQDDGGGTHFTGTGSVGYLTAPGAGAVPFVYWITATKDMVIITFRAAGYTGCYIGITEPFALILPDETYQMVSVGLHTDDGAENRPYARVLHRYDDTWDYLCNVDECTHEYVPNDLDGSHALFGAYVYNTADHRENYGQLLYCSGRIESGTGINPEDTITSGYPGATSEWIVFGAGGLRWAVATSGPLPLGVQDGANWGYTTGVAGDVNALQAALEGFLTAKGWVIADWPVPEYAIDRSFSSVGENGVETIVIRWQDSGTMWGALVYDAIGGAHNTARYGPGLTDVSAGDFPIRYYFTGDRDCFLVVLERAGIFGWLWCGCCKSFFPDPAVIDTTYMVGIGHNLGAESKACLRRPNGLWVGGLNEFLWTGYTNSSPSLIDGTTFVVWPYTVYASGVANRVPWGTFQYLYRMSSTSVTLGDTVQIGLDVFMYIGGNYGIKIA